MGLTSILNQPDPEVEKAWAKEARRRLKEFEEGKKWKLYLGNKYIMNFGKNIPNELPLSSGSSPYK